MGARRPVGNPIRMNLGALAERWGREIGRDPAELSVAIISAAAAGEFDALSALERVVTIDSETLKIEPIEKGPLVANLRAMDARFGRSRNSFVSSIAPLLHIHQAAVRLFAGARGLCLPSWLGEVEAPAPAEPPTAPAVEVGSARKKREPQTLDAVVAALTKLFPDGVRPSVDRKRMLALVEQEVGRPVSPSTLDRARKLLRLG